MHYNWPTPKTDQDQSDPLIHRLSALLIRSVVFFSRPLSEGWPHHRRTFSIYPCPLSFWLTLPRGVLSAPWCCPPRPCVVFLSELHSKRHRFEAEAWNRRMDGRGDRSYAAAQNRHRSPVQQRPVWQCVELDPTQDESRCMVWWERFARTVVFLAEVSRWIISINLFAQQGIAPRSARRYAPTDGSSTRGGSTSVRGRSAVRTWLSWRHQRAYSLGQQNLQKREVLSLMWKSEGVMDDESGGSMELMEEVPLKNWVRQNWRD